MDSNETKERKARFYPSVFVMSKEIS